MFNFRQFFFLFSAFHPQKQHHFPSSNVQNYPCPWQHTFVSPSAFSRRAVVSYWRKYVHEVLVNRLGGLSLPRKSMVRLTDRPDMTLDVYRGRKTTLQQCNPSPWCKTYRPTLPAPGGPSRPKYISAK